MLILAGFCVRFKKFDKAFTKLNGAVMDVQKVLNKDIKRFYKKALSLALRYRGYLLQAYKINANQKKAIKIRKNGMHSGIEVPPAMIISVTHKCNLNCEGCYAKALHTGKEPEMGQPEFEKLLSEAHELGVATVLIAGGEPFMRKGILESLTKFPDMLFIMFTNGTMIDNNAAEVLKRDKNIIPVISIEGEAGHTEKRRGEGMAQLTENAMKRLKQKGLLFGLSFTVTSGNLRRVTSEDFVKKQMEKGAGVVFYISYVPFEKGTESLSIKQEGTEYLRSAVEKLDKALNTMFVCFPADEDRLGGCISAGTGFIHVSPSGDIEPCPFSPYKGYNIRDNTLIDALGSKYFKAIRQNRHLLDEKDGVCALFENKEWLESLKKEINE